MAGKVLDFLDLPCGYTFWLVGRSENPEPNNHVISTASSKNREVNFWEGSASGNCTLVCVSCQKIRPSNSCDFRNGRVAQVVECLLNKHEVLNSNPSTTKKRKQITNHVISIANSSYREGNC
jgi:NAD-dependent dihydropyrimidine dehydrogenase PreA subunit